MLSFDNSKKIFLYDESEILLSKEDIIEIETHNWWHSIPFSSTAISRGREKSVQLIVKHRLDKVDFKGKSVLGIGCYEGFQLYYAEAMGASKVVGLKFDFNLYPSIDKAREFSKRVLKSKVSFVDTDIYSLSPETIGTFDIVLMFDSVEHLLHPMLAIERVSKICRERLVFASKFLLIDEEHAWNKFPVVHEPKGSWRTTSLVNYSWIKVAWYYHGFALADEDIWENDYISATGDRFVLKQESVPLDQLPTDNGFEGRVAVVVVTCQKYSEAWAPFFTLFNRYWSDCPYRVYLVTDTGTHPGVETLSVGKDLGWQANLKKMLDRIDADYVFLFQEDFLLTQQVDTVKVRRLVRHAFDYRVGCLRLYPSPAPTGRWHGTDYLGTIGPFDEFRFSLQLAIWKKSLLAGLLNEEEDFWLLEFVGSRRAAMCSEPFISVVEDKTMPIHYFMTGIINGKWHPGAIELLRRENICTEQLSLKIETSPTRLIEDYKL